MNRKDYDRIRAAMMPGASEHDEQAALIDWCRLNEGAYPQLKWIMAIPNGTFTTRASAVKAILEGVKKGVADLFLPYPNFVLDNDYYALYSGLWIEMKSKTGQVKPEQKAFVKDMRVAGYAAEVCRGFDAARRLILAYLEGSYRPSKEGMWRNDEGEVEGMG